MSGNEFDERAVAERQEPQPTEAWPSREQAAGESGNGAPAADAPAAEAEADTVSPEADTVSPEADAAAPSPEAEAEAAAPSPGTDEPAPNEPDPFASWPQAESAVVVEDAPDEGTSLEHVEGEIDVPDGYTVLEGMPLGKRRSVAVVVSRFNGGLTNRMLSRALDALEEAEVAPDAVTVVPVPGAFELPLAAMALAKTRRFACVIALGAIVRGETPHFDYIASEAASGLQLAGIETGVPVAFGVLTVETVEQGEARIDRAADAVRTALEMADLFARLRASAH